MKALRVVRERSGHGDPENDLRGLGKTSILGDHNPEPILFVNTTTPHLTVSQMQKLEIQLTEFSGFVALTSSSSKHYKEQALDLFVALALMSTKDKSAHFFLTELNHLNEAMHDGIANTSESKNDKIVKMHSNWKQSENRAEISMQNLLTLTQAGLFPQVVAERGYLTNEELATIPKTLKHFAKKSKFTIHSGAA